MADYSDLSGRMRMVSFRNTLAGLLDREKSLSQAVADGRGVVDTLQGAMNQLAARHAEELEVVKSQLAASQDAANQAKRELQEELAATRDSLAKCECAKDALQRTLEAREEYTRRLETQAVQAQVGAAPSARQPGTQGTSYRDQAVADEKTHELMACVEEHLALVKQAASAAAAQEATLRAEVALLKATIAEADRKLTATQIVVGDAVRGWVRAATAPAGSAGGDQVPSAGSPSQEPEKPRQSLSQEESSQAFYSQQIHILSEELRELKHTLAATLQLFQKASLTIVAQEAQILALQSAPAASAALPGLTQADTPAASAGLASGSESVTGPGPLAMTWSTVKASEGAAVASHAAAPSPLAQEAQQRAVPTSAQPAAVAPIGTPVAAEDMGMVELPTASLPVSTPLEAAFLAPAGPVFTRRSPEPLSSAVCSGRSAKPVTVAAASMPLAGEVRAAVPQALLSPLAVDAASANGINPTDELLPVHDSSGAQPVAADADFDRDAPM